MASLIHGYNYDIFISYRQNDNKHDGWVTEFVENLKGELESTFKEDISVYFDMNPQDGLLETHEVGDSLKEKLKCLIFIPLISRTYCDLKSFAWEHEFNAFVENASNDQFGLKVKLLNGNLANRVLPVLIHDLDVDDIKLCESVLGGALRSVDFTYKSAGVNRPLRVNEDHPQDNLNKTYYRDQVNKVANAIKEIISALKRPDQRPEEDAIQDFSAISTNRKNLKIKRIAGSLILLILFILGCFLVPKLFDSSGQLEKSVAVLPFINDSPETKEDNTPFINGLMEEIIINLQSINDLRVPGRTSVEQFRNNKTKSIPEIAKEIGVNYIIEGSCQKYGNTFRLRIQLIRARGKESHIWAHSYEQEIKGTKDIFSIQSEIALAIASELKSVISPVEKQIIEKTSTSDLTAYDFFQRGRDEQIKFWTDNRNKAALENARDLYHKALQYDSAYAQAYTGLAWVYWSQHYWKEFFSKSFLDSILILTNIALSYDNQLAEAYSVRGEYYNEIGKKEEAISNFDKAVRLNPNDWMAYYLRGNIYFNIDYVKGIENFQKASSLMHGALLPTLLRSLGDVYRQIGFIEKASYYNQEAFQLDKDSLQYYSGLSANEYNLGNFKKSLEYDLKAYALDSGNIDFCYVIAQDYMFLNKNEETLKFIKEWQKRSKSINNNDLFGAHRIGWAYWQNGYKKEGQYYFKKQIEYCDKVQKMGRTNYDPLRPSYDLAATYAFMGDRINAYLYLKMWSKISVCPLWWLNCLKYDPLFVNISNEPEFQQIIRDVEAKYQSEHERVRKWLEENKML